MTKEPYCANPECMYNTPLVDPAVSTLTAENNGQTFVDHRHRHVTASGVKVCLCDTCSAAVQIVKS